MDFKSFLFVGLGGAVGSVLRFGVNHYVNKLFPIVQFPLSTFLVNIIGCFVLGYFSAYTHTHTAYPFIKPFLIIGVCGGFTTFSTFAYDNYALINGGMNFLSMLYILLSVLLGIVMVYLGFYFFDEV